MKLLEQKEKELQRISNEIKKLSQGNPQQQRKCARLKEDHQRLVQEIQKLRENQNKDKKRLDELRKQIEANEGNEKSKKKKRKKLEKEYEELRKMLGVGKELKENAERIDDYNENTSSLKTDENMYLDEQHLKVKPIQKDQYGVYEQVRNLKTVEERMTKRKKIESEAENTFIIRKANLCELESDIDDVRKRMANPIIQKFEAELKLIRKKSSKDTKKLKTETKSLLRALSNATFRGRHNGPIAIRTKRASSQTSQEGSSIRLHLIWPVTEVMKKKFSWSWRQF
ncbi:Ras-related protein [Dirofilaria immitis]